MASQVWLLAMARPMSGRVVEVSNWRTQLAWGGVLGEPGPVLRCLRQPSRTPRSCRATIQSSWGVPPPGRTWCCGGKGRDRRAYVLDPTHMSSHGPLIQSTRNVQCPRAYMLIKITLQCLKSLYPCHFIGNLKTWVGRSWTCARATSSASERPYPERQSPCNTPIKAWRW